MHQEYRKTLKEDHVNGWPENWKRKWIIETGSYGKPENRIRRTTGQATNDFEIVVTF